MNKLKAGIPVIICIVLFLIAGRSKMTEPVENVKNVKTGGEHIEAERGTYVFKDVEGIEYEAELLENVPRCVYDFDGLKTDEETGRKIYGDPNGKVTAIEGIDVSEFQGEEIDWDKVKESGIEFAVIRIGYRAYGESGDLVPDAMYEANIKGAAEAGLIVGVYFFSQAVNETEAREEAEFVLEMIKPYEITGPVVYDTEEIKWDTARTDNNTVQDFTNCCKMFCDTVKKAGYAPMIYSNMKWMAFSLEMDQLTEYDFWYADYYDIPQCPYDFKMWQYSENGVVPGINSNVDLNLWFQEDEKE